MNAKEEAAKKLSTTLTDNQAALLEEAKTNPEAAKTMKTTLETLANEGYGTQALQVLSTIESNPALKEAFKDQDLNGKLLETSALAATAEELAKNNGDPIDTAKKVKEMLEPFKSVLDGYQDFVSGIEEIANGDYDYLKGLSDDFKDKSSSARLYAGIGVLVGAYSATDSARQGEYGEAIKGYAEAGKEGLELLAGATKHLANSGKLGEGRLASHVEDFAKFGGQLARGLGIVASAFSTGLAAQKAIDTDGNAGYYAELGGEVLGATSALLMVTRFAPFSGAVGAVGSVVATIGGYVGDQIEFNRIKDDVREYMTAAGVDSQYIDKALMQAGRGAELHAMQNTLDMTPEQIQSLMTQKDTWISNYPSIFGALAESYGLKGDQVLEFAQKIGSSRESGFLEFIKSYGEGLQIGVNSTLMQGILQDKYPDAHAYASQIKTTQNDVKVAAEQEWRSKNPELAQARDDYLKSTGGKAWNAQNPNFEQVLMMYQNNTDAAYRGEMLRLLRENGHGRTADQIEKMVK